MLLNETQKKIVNIFFILNKTITYEFVDKNKTTGAINF